MPEKSRRITIRQPISRLTRAEHGTLDWRADPQNLPAGLTKPWPGAGYACFGGGDLSGMYTERAELYDFIRDQRIEGLVTVSGDRHSFWAGYSAKSLPPQAFEPVGIAFITGSISAPGFAEEVELARFQQRRERGTHDEAADMRPPGDAGLRGIGERGVEQLHHEPEPHHEHRADAEGKENDDAQRHQHADPGARIEQHISPQNARYRA